MEEGREEGRGKREEGRGKREEGRGKREEGRGKREEGRVLGGHLTRMEGGLVQQKKK
jgi:hypothetical protein